MRHALHVRRSLTPIIPFPSPCSSTSLLPARLPRRSFGIRFLDTAAASKPIKTVISSSDQPQWALDGSGNRVGPLEPYVDALGGSARRSKVKQKANAEEVDSAGTSQEEAVDKVESYEDAVAAGSIPDSGLARVIFDAWQRFPDCIIFTRVGKFYESYYAPAFDVASLLSLKLAYRRYKSGSYPFAGFPIPQLDKYLKILVHDLRRTVVLLEEYDEDGSRRDGGTGSDSITRKVGRVVTPGTLDEHWFSGDESRYLLSIALPELPLDPTTTESSTPASNLSNTETQDEGDSPTASPAVALAYADITTGEFFTKDATLAQMEDELARLSPREIVLDHSWRASWESTVSSSPLIAEFFELLRLLRVHVSFTDPFVPTDSLESQQVSTPTLPRTPAPSAETLAITLLRRHLEYALRDAMPSIPGFNRQSSRSFMQIDAATLQALEIRHSLRPGGLSSPSQSTTSGISLSNKGSLLSVLSRTITPSGHRLLIRTLTAPSTSLEIINTRLALVQAFIDRETLRTDTRDALRGLIDVMRAVQHFKSREGAPRDIWDVSQWVRVVERILAGVKQEIGRGGRRKVREDGGQAEGAERLREVVEGFRSLGDLAKKIEDSIDEGTVMRATEEVAGDEEGEEGVGVTEKKEAQTKREEKERDRDEKDDAMLWLKPSFSPTIRAFHDKLRSLRSQRDEMQRTLRDKLGVPTLLLQRGSKAGWVVGVAKKSEYDVLVKKRDFQSISVSSKTLSYGPWNTLGHQLEETVEKLVAAQRKAFEQLRALVISRAEEIQHNAELVDELDLSMSFAQTAVELNYVRPVLTNGTDLHIVNGRHPSVESGLLTSSRTFTPNSTHMTPSSFLHIITGPNQGGKSTLLRQTAIIAILAQSGSFVPADSATMGIVDRVFSRVGARDDLYRDRGTFMLEMVETAAILKHATPRSLVIMDEIGRGTTLNAGVSIAYATLDHLLTHIKCRTLFATHYHELADMLTIDGPASHAAASESRLGVSYFCTDVNEVGGAFSYSYRLQPGVNRNSHAIKAAQLAGMPESFLQTAQATLETLQHTPLSRSS